MSKENNKLDQKMLSDFEMDQLREVINIGGSHASTALSQLIKKKVTITVPEVIIDRVENISKIIGKEEEIATAIILDVLGDTTGVFSYLITHNKNGEEILKIVSLISGEKRSKKGIVSEYDLSVLKEMGNILAGATFAAFSKFLNINMIQSVSEAITDMTGSIVNSVMAEIAESSDKVLIFKVKFNVECENVKSELYFFLDPKATAKILRATKEKIS